MLRSAAVVAAAVWLMGMPARAASDAETAKEIVAMERKALDAWVTGNPDPMLSMADSKITYFHIMTEERLDGIAALKSLFEQYRGVPLFDSYEMADPKVQVMGDAAVLTYVVSFRRNGAITKYNSTQVYQRQKDGWKVVHSHWSRTAG